MDVTKIGLVLLLLVICETTAQLFHLPHISSCYQDSDCSAEYCCAKRTGPIIMSRAIHTTPDPATVKGTCRPWVKQGGWCGGLWRQNGVCGCAPSLTCHWYPPTASPIKTIGKRKMMAGDYICEPRN